MLPELENVAAVEPLKFSTPTPVEDEVSVNVPAVSVKCLEIFRVPLPAPAPEDNNNCPPGAFIVKSLAIFITVVPVLLVLEPAARVELKIISLLILSVSDPVALNTTLEVPSMLRSAGVEAPTSMVHVWVSPKLILPKPVLMILSSPAISISNPSKLKILALLLIGELKWKSPNV